MISVVKRKLITSVESFFTSAPITPRDVSRRYSNGRDLEVVLRNGYRKSGMWAACSKQLATGSSKVAPQDGLPLRKRVLVSACDATHCNKANALHTLFDAAAVS